jgi:hypothetical protein
MYYLVIKNLEVEKCIDKNQDDIYEDNQNFSFLQDLYFVKTKVVRRIEINCIEIPGTVFNATVYSD